MLLAVGGESRRIVLGEVPPAQPEQEQEPAQDVAAQWRMQENQNERNGEKITVRDNAKIRGLSNDIKNQHGTRSEDIDANKRRASIRNRKSRRRRVRVSGNHP